MNNSFVKRIAITSFSIVIFSFALHFFVKPIEAETSLISNTQFYKCNPSSLGIKTYISDYDKFVKIAHATLTENDNRITKLKIAMNDAGAKKQVLLNQMTTLSFKNDSLKIILSNYQLSGQGNWKNFENSFFLQSDHINKICDQINDHNKYCEN